MLSCDWYLELINMKGMNCPSLEGTHAIKNCYRDAAGVTVLIFVLIFVEQSIEISLFSAIGVRGII